jgi:hypothetical protein
MNAVQLKELSTSFITAMVLAAYREESKQVLNPNLNEDELADLYSAYMGGQSWTESR